MTHPPEADRATKSRLLGLLTVLVSLALALLLAEAVFRVQYAWQGKTPPHWDRSTSREWRWADRHLREGAAVLPGEAVYDPIVGWRTVPNMNLNGVRTNSAGMRSPHEFSEEWTRGRRRLLLVGDSYTFGSFVEDEISYHQVLGRDHLPDWEILNLGVAGYGPDQALLLYEQVGRRYRPDVAVFGFYDRGFFRLFQRFRSYAKPRLVLDENQALRLEGTPVISPEELYEQYRSGERRIGGWGHSYFVGGLLRNLFQALRDRPIDAEDVRWKLMAQVLRRFQRVAIADGSVPFLLIFPDRPERCDGCVNEQVGRLAEAEAEALGMPVLSLREPFLAHQGESLFRPKGQGGHLSATGHALVARRLYQALADAGLTETP